MRVGLVVKLDLWHCDWFEFRYHLQKQFLPTVKLYCKDLIVQSLPEELLPRKFFRTSREFSIEKTIQETHCWISQRKSNDIKQST